MKTTGLKYFPRCLAFFVFLVIAVLGLDARGDSVSIIGINVSPPTPAITDSITLTGHIGAGYFTIDYLGSSSQRSGATIELDYYFYDSFPGGDIRIDLAGGAWYVPAAMGLLPQGTYSVHAKAWIDDYMTPGWINYGGWGPFNWDDPGLSYRQAQEYNTSFVVTPEPTTVMLFGLGGLIYFHRRPALKQAG